MPIGRSQIFPVLTIGCAVRAQAVGAARGVVCSVVRENGDVVD